MASIRRTLSGRICRLRASSSCYSSLSGKIAGSSTLSQAFSLFPLMLLARSVAMVDGGPKASVWRKLLLQCGVCFSLGLCLGFFTPHSKWPAAYVPGSLVEGENFIEADLLKAAEETNMDSLQVRVPVDVDAGIGSRFPGDVLLQHKKNCCKGMQIACGLLIMIYFLFFCVMLLILTLVSARLVGEALRILKEATSAACTIFNWQNG